MNARPGLLVGIVLLAVAACATSAPTSPAPASASAPSASSAGSAVASSLPSSTAVDAVPPCTLPMLTFALAPWEGAMGTAYGNVVIGLTSGPTSCSLHGALEVAVTGPAAPAIAADGRALPADLVLRQEPLDAAAPQTGEAVIRLTFRNWCPDQPADGSVQVQLVPLGVSPPLPTTFPTPACATPGEPATLKIGPITDGAS